MPTINAAKGIDIPHANAMVLLFFWRFICCFCKLVGVLDCDVVFEVFVLLVVLELLPVLSLLV